MSNEDREQLQRASIDECKNCLMPLRRICFRQFEWGCFHADALGDDLVQILERYKAPCLKNGHEVISYDDRVGITHLKQR